MCNATVSRTTGPQRQLGSHLVGIGALLCCGSGGGRRETTRGRAACREHKRSSLLGRSSVARYSMGYCSHSAGIGDHSCGFRDVVVGILVAEPIDEKDGEHECQRHEGNDTHWRITPHAQLLLSQHSPGVQQGAWRVCVVLAQSRHDSPQTAGGHEDQR